MIAGQKLLAMANRKFHCREKKYRKNLICGIFGYWDMFPSRICEHRKFLAYSFRITVNQSRAQNVAHLLNFYAEWFSFFWVSPHSTFLVVQRPTSPTGRCRNKNRYAVSTSYKIWLGASYALARFTHKA